MSQSVTEKGSELSEMQGSVECAKVRGWVRRESPEIYPPLKGVTLWGGRGRQPNTGSSGAGVNLTTLKTGCSLLMEGGRRRQYALFPAFPTMVKGPSVTPSNTQG